MRIDSQLPAVYLGSASAVPRTVVPVAATAPAPPPQRETARSAEAPALARWASGAWPAAAIDARQAGLRVRQAIEAYTAVRDGEQRDYLRRVMGLEATA
jgi:hypothetical protein